MANKTGVYPVFENKFKIGARGAAAKNTIADMETFTVAIDGNVEEWKPMEAEGWVRRMVTGKSLKITLSGKRSIGDAGNDYVANSAWAPVPPATAALSGSFPVVPSWNLTVCSALPTPAAVIPQTWRGWNLRCRVTANPPLPPLHPADFVLCRANRRAGLGFEMNTTQWRDSLWANCIPWTASC